MYSGTAGEVELQEGKRPQAACFRREVQSCSALSGCMLVYIYTGSCRLRRGEMARGFGGDK